MNSNNPQNNAVIYPNGSDIRDSWKQRSKLEQKLIICLVIVVIVLTGFVLFVLIKLTGFPDVCHTPACLLSASQIISHIDPSVDPCEDFFKFACGKFIEQSHGDIKEASILQIEQDIQRQLGGIIKEPIRDDDNYWVRSQKALFEACLNETAAEDDALREFLKLLDELRGWPVVDSSRWNERLFDWKEIVYKLRDKGYAYNMMLDVGVLEDYDRNNSNKHIVWILPPDVKRIDNEDKMLYKKYMVDVAAKFGADKNYASIEMGNVLTFMENLRNLVDQFDLEGEITRAAKFNHSEALLQTRFTVRDYQRRSNRNDWLDYLNTILYPAANITIDDYVLFPKVEFTRAFYRLLHETRNRVQANYIIWTVLQDIMQYLPKEIQDLEASYLCSIDSKPKDKDRAEFCQRTIKDSYHYFQPSEIVYARRFLPKVQRTKVEEMVKNIKSEFISTLEQNTWMDAETKRKAVEKAKGTAEIIGAPDDYFDDALFEKYFDNSNPDFFSGNFFQMFLIHNKLQINSVYMKVYKNVSDAKLDPFYSFTTTVNAMYWFPRNAMIIPVGILRGVFYSPDRPMYLNYGAIGSIIGHELTHGFCETGSRHDKDGYDDDMWSERTKKAYKEKTECIIKEADNFLMGDLKVKINVTQKLEEDIADYTGLKVSYAAYKNWIGQNGGEAHLPGISYTPQQLFWISAVSYECFEIDANASAKEDLQHAHHLFRVIAPLRNNLDFANDFNCRVGSKMNPSNKCQVF